MRIVARVRLWSHTCDAVEESKVSADANDLAICSDAEGCEVVDRILGAPDSWEPSLIGYRFRKPFQADWKAEVGRWLLLAEQLGFINPLVTLIRKRVLKEAAKPKVTGANDSAHVCLGQELAAAMTVYYLVRSGWVFVEWEPKLPRGVKGDADIRLRCPLGTLTDIQVKAPDQPGERSGGQIVDGEYDDRICTAVDKALMQIHAAPGPQRMVVVSPQRLWAYGRTTPDDAPGGSYCRVCEWCHAKSDRSGCVCQRTWKPSRRGDAPDTLTGNLGEAVSVYCLRESVGTREHSTSASDASQRARLSS